MTDLCRSGARQGDTRRARSLDFRGVAPGQSFRRWSSAATPLSLGRRGLRWGALCPRGYRQRVMATRRRFLVGSGSCRWGRTPQTGPAPWAPCYWSGRCRGRWNVPFTSVTRTRQYPVRQGAQPGDMSKARSLDSQGVAPGQCPRLWTLIARPLSLEEPSVHWDTLCPRDFRRRWKATRRCCQDVLVSFRWATTPPIGPAPRAPCCYSARCRDRRRVSRRSSSGR
mmetsp:Transcript_15521/g.50672  ORF Transcript_15521/g.50672 Transcript_15521/m.50672 type:complete len:225 (+) Transcript_15521:151-825(+)